MPAATRSHSALPLALPRREGEELRLDWSTYRGARFLNLRVYYRGPDGRMHPTRQGITIAPRHLPEVSAAIARAAEELTESGRASGSELSTDSGSKPKTASDPLRLDLADVPRRSPCAQAAGR